MDHNIMSWLQKNLFVCLFKSTSIHWDIRNKSKVKLKILPTKFYTSYTKGPYISIALILAFIHGKNNFWSHPVRCPNKRVGRTNNRCWTKISCKENKHYVRHPNKWVCRTNNRCWIKISCEEIRLSSSIVIKSLALF